MRLALLPLVLAVLLVAAACGGDDDEAATQDEQSSTEAWADGFCSAATDWRTSLEDAVSGFDSPSDLSADGIRAAVDEGLDATESFLADVRELEQPDTEAGQEIEEVVDSMSSSVESTMEDLRSSFDEDASLQDLLGQVAAAATQIGGLQDELQSSLDQLQSVDTGELRSALESNEDCAAARSGSGS